MNSNVKSEFRWITPKPDGSGNFFIDTESGGSGGYLITQGVESNGNVTEGAENIVSVANNRMLDECFQANNIVNRVLMLALSNPGANALRTGVTKLNKQYEVVQIIQYYKD